MSYPTSLQMLASKGLGGAERWFIRFNAALAERQVPTELAIRRGSALEKMDFGALPVHRLPYRTTWDPYSRRAAARLIRSARPDIVQTYMGRATRLIRLPYPGRPIHLVRLGGYYALAPYRHAHGWIGNTRGLCDWLIRQGLPPSRVHHIYNFVDPARPLPKRSIEARRADYDIPPDAWILVTLGRLVPVKGHRHLIGAMARLPNSVGGRPVRVFIVGDGPLAAPLQRAAADTGQSGRIIWTGWQVDPGPFLQLADLVVFPSLDAETLGNVILEAWTWQRPLLTTRFRGAREIVRHGEDAWCVPCENDTALAQGIVELLGNDPLRQRLAQGGHNRVEREFGRDAIIDQYLELYRSLTGE